MHNENPLLNSEKLSNHPEVFLKIFTIKTIMMYIHMKCIPLHILTKDIDHDSTADTFFRKKLIVSRLFLLVVPYV